MKPVRQFFMVAFCASLLGLMAASQVASADRTDRDRGGRDRGVRDGGGKFRGGNPGVNPGRGARGGGGAVVPPPRGGVVIAPNPGRPRNPGRGDNPGRGGAVVNPNPGHGGGPMRDNRRRAREERGRLRRDFGFNIGVDRGGIHIGARWGNRYDRWRRHHHRPHRPVIGRQIRWFVPMPFVDADRWNTSHVEAVALNLESLARDMYRTLARSGASRQFMGEIGQLAAAAENYQDGVEASYDFSRNNLYDLFYVDEVLSGLEQRLHQYPLSYLIVDEVQYFRYYVNELLWLYRSRGL